MRTLRLLHTKLIALTILPLLLLLLPTLALAHAPAQQSVTVKLEPMNGSTVTGSAVLTANGAATDAIVDLKNLPAKADGLVNLYANTCALPSASFAFIANFTADAAGSVHLTAPVLFHGGNVTLPEITNSNIIAVYSGGQMVACGVVPTLAPTSPALPTTGGVFDLRAILLLGIAGFTILSLGALITLKNRAY